MKGIDEGYDLPREAEDDMWSLTERERKSLGIEPLPKSLYDAIGIAENSELLAETLGEHVFDFFLRNKRSEWEDYRGPGLRARARPDAPGRMTMIGQPGRVVFSPQRARQLRDAAGHLARRRRLPRRGGRRSRSAPGDTGRAISSACPRLTLLGYTRRLPDPAAAPPLAGQGALRDDRLAAHRGRAGAGRHPVRTDPHRPRHLRWSCCRSGASASDARLAPVEHRPVVLVVEHEPACPPAHFGTWLTEAGAELRVCRPWAGDELPGARRRRRRSLVLGGSMGANDDDTCPWLGAVKDRIREAVASGLPTLGICLGHQLVAVALGGRSEPNAAGQQVGLFDVGWTPEAANDELVGPVAAPRRGVQWNNDVVTELPDGAVALASTAGRGEPGGAVRARRLGRAAAPRGRPGRARRRGPRATATTT